MNGKNGLLVLLCGLLSLSMVNANPHHQSTGKTVKICNNEESCLNNDACQCYCSWKCGFRKKDMANGDRPVFVKNDPNGKGCYCKQWDLDNYNKRHCAVKEKAMGGYRNKSQSKRSTQKQQRQTHKSSHKLTQWNAEEYN